MNDIPDQLKSSIKAETLVLSDFTNHSGGAYGGDTFWDLIGREFGFTNHKHYKDSGNASLSQQLRNKGIKAIVLTKEQMSFARQKVKELLGIEYKDDLKGNLQVRNFYQVYNADAVYAIAKLDYDNNKVSGGTNTAVQLGIKLNKPVYVWDINTEQWYSYEKSMSDPFKGGLIDGFVQSQTPALTKNFAGIGSRDIENYNVQIDGNWQPRKEYVGKEKEEKAKQAIRDVYEKTLVNLEINSNKVPINNTTPQVQEEVTPTKTINVYWGQAESETSTRILSNLAPRRFKFKSVDGVTREYGSVEHAYQSLKSGVFDEVTYNKYVAIGGYGSKIRGKAANSNFDNLKLIKDLVVESFKQNPNSESANKLMQYDNFTHNTNELIDQAFLEGLKLAKKELSKIREEVKVENKFKNDLEKEKIFQESIKTLPVYNINRAFGNYHLKINETLESKLKTNEISLSELFTISSEPYVLEVYHKTAESSYKPDTALVKKVLVVPQLKKIFDINVDGKVFVNFNDNFNSYYILDSSKLLSWDFKGLDFNYKEGINLLDLNIFNSPVEVDTALGKKVTYDKDYKYFGATYTIELTNGKPTNVIGYRGSDVKMQKILDAYAANPDIDVQNGQRFRNFEVDTIQPSQTKSIGSKSSTLNPDQLLAKEKALKVLNAPIHENIIDDMFLISGAGGTGKTYLVETIMDEFSRKDVRYSTTTWNAVNNLKANVSKSDKVHTLASFIGTTVSEPRDNGEQDFVLLDDSAIEDMAMKGVLPKIFTTDVIILDEISMIGGNGKPPEVTTRQKFSKRTRTWETVEEYKTTDSWEAFKFRLAQRERLGYGRPSKILVMGDYAQVPPIGTGVDTDSAIMTELMNRPDQHAILTINMRTNKDDILEHHTKYRKNIDVANEGLKKGKKSNDTISANPVPFQGRKNSRNIKFMNDIDSIVNKFVEIYKSNADNVSNIVFVNYNKYTRPETKNLIDKIRVGLFGEDPYVYELDELLILNSEFDITVDGKKIEFKKDARFVVKGVERAKKELSPYIMGQYIDGHILTLKTQVAGKDVVFNKFVPDEGLWEKIKGPYRGEIPGYEIFGREFFYGDYKDMEKQFNVDISYGYVVNSHRVQGSTYNHVFVDEQNILKAPMTNKQINQSLYTAMSRPRESLYSYHPSNPNQVLNDLNDLEILETLKIPVKITGINIYSKSNDPLGKRLTNPNWYAKDLMDVETPYKANASKIKAPQLNAQEALRYDMNLMYKLQVQKFQKNPELIDEINERGGLQFILNSEHTVGVRGSRWEGKGTDSNFIKVLAQSYITVAKEFNKFQDLNDVKQVEIQEIPEQTLNTPNLNIDLESTTLTLETLNLGQFNELKGKPYKLYSIYGTRGISSIALHKDTVKKIMSGEQGLSIREFEGTESGTYTIEGKKFIINNLGTGKINSFNLSKEQMLKMSGIGNESNIREKSVKDFFEGNSEKTLYEISEEQKLDSCDIPF